MGKKKRLTQAKAAAPAHTPTYNFTLEQLNEFCNRRFQEKIVAERWVTEAFVLDFLNQLEVDCLNIGIQIVYTALMEQHLLGWSRIERDLKPFVEEMFDEWSEYALELDGFAEDCIDVLDRRTDKARKASTRKLLSNGGDTDAG